MPLTDERQVNQMFAFLKVGFNAGKQGLPGPKRKGFEVPAVYRAASLGFALGRAMRGQMTTSAKALHAATLAGFHGVDREKYKDDDLTRRAWEAGQACRRF